MTTPTVGLIGLPDLRRVLSSAGFRGVGGAGESTGATWRNDAAAINESKPAPSVIFADGSARLLGLRTWLDKKLPTAVVVVLRAAPDSIQVPGAVMVDLPAALEAILAAAGLPGDGGRFQVNPDLTIGPRKAAAPAPVAAEPIFTPTGGADSPEAAPEPSEAVWTDSGATASDGDELWPVPTDAQPPSPTVAPAAQALTSDSEPAYDEWDMSGGSQGQTQAPDDPWASSGPSSTPVSADPPRPSRTPTPAVPEMLDPDFDPIYGIDPEMVGPSGIRPAPVRRREGAVVFVVAAKGGVGKTTSAMSLAALAAQGGLDVVAVDMNRGQGDIQPYLRIPTTATLPTAYSALGPGGPAASIISAADITIRRHATLPAIEFDVVLAPEKDQPNPQLVDANVYRSIIEYCRSRHDLTVVDTREFETFDASGLIDGVVTPMLFDRSVWAVAISDGDGVAISNLYHRLKKLNSMGISRDRLLLVLADVTPESLFTGESTLRTLEQFARNQGTIFSDNAGIKHPMNVGRIPTGQFLIRQVLGRTLGEITGDPVFADMADAPDPRASKRGTLARLLRRGRR